MQASVEDFVSELAEIMPRLEKKHRTALLLTLSQLAIANVAGPSTTASIKSSPFSKFFLLSLIL